MPNLTWMPVHGLVHTWSPMGDQCKFCKFVLFEPMLVWHQLLNCSPLIEYFRSTPNLCSIHCSQDPACDYFYHENSSCQFAEKLGLVASSEVSVTKWILNRIESGPSGLYQIWYSKISWIASIILSYRPFFKDSPTAKAVYKDITDYCEEGVWYDDRFNIRYYDPIPDLESCQKKCIDDHDAKFFTYCPDPAGASWSCFVSDAWFSKLECRKFVPSFGLRVTKYKQEFVQMPNNSEYQRKYERLT